MRNGSWNHNIHYHDFVLRLVPPDCERALDVGCGQGILARRLACKCLEVVAIDTDHETLLQARDRSAPEPRVNFIEGDVMTQSLSVNTYDFIACIATLHHLPLTPALTRFKNLLRPGGMLVIIGLYRAHTLADYACAAAALPVSRIMRVRYGHEEVTAPLAEPKETLREIQSASRAILPGSVFRRRLLFRYSLVWRKT